MQEIVTPEQNSMMTDEEREYKAQGKERPWIKKFSPNRAERVIDRLLVRMLNMIERLPQLSVCRRDCDITPGQLAKRTDDRVLPGDPLEFQFLFKLKEMMDETNLIEDPADRSRAQIAIVKEMIALGTRLSERSDQIIKVIQDLLSRSDKHTDLNPDDLYRLAGKEVGVEQIGNGVGAP